MARARPRASACSVVVQRLGNGRTAFDQFRAVREARVFLFKLRDFVGLEPRRLQFAHLVAQQLRASRSALWR